MPKKEKIIVTAALPYTNGQIHIGHLLEYIQADIFARFLKLQGNDALYICASDMHGTPIEVNAQKQGIKPEQFALKFWKEHQQDFKSFLIKFDNYYKTHSKENKELTEFFYAKFLKKNLIYRKKINTIYCENCARTLPDRFVKGTCPNCTTTMQYGDVCENCNSALKGTDLINPKCTLCNKTPIQKENEHYFFKLSAFSNKIKKWVEKMQPEIKNWVNDWLKKGLEDWCFSRDEPYFGFEIPKSKKETGEKKYFYVWMDAPIGYISSTKNYCDKHKKGKWEDYWNRETRRVSGARMEHSLKKGIIQHFIGKDIAFFHYLYWPAMLMGADIPLPKLTTHGFITVNGQKMSKSRGTFFTAKDFIKLYPAEALRFFYASHLDRKVVDIDLNFEDFLAVHNNVLLGSLGNFCYRVITFAQKNYSEVNKVAEEKELTKKVEKLFKLIEKNYQEQDFKSAVKNILKIADIGNTYFQKSEAWKDKEGSKDKVGWCVNLARNLSILVSPILPEFSEKVKRSLREKNLSWNNLGFKWKGKLKKIEMLVEKIEKIPETAKFPLKMVVGKIIEVKNHPDADSLYLFKVDLGKGKKQVVAGLKKYLEVKELLNRKAVFCLNMKPAKIRGETSEAMILAADDAENVNLLDVSKTKEGQEVQFTGIENNDQEVSFEEFKKLVIEVKDGNVWYEGQKLVSKTEDIIVTGIKDGARVT